MNGKGACEICEQRKMIPSNLTEMELINDEANVAGHPTHFGPSIVRQTNERNDAFIKYLLTAKCNWDKNFKREYSNA